jgi:hypothetical protein
MRTGIRAEQDRALAELVQLGEESGNYLATPEEAIRRAKAARKKVAQRAQP